MGRQLTITVNGAPFEVEVLSRTRDAVRFAVAGRSYEVEFTREAPATVRAAPEAGATSRPAAPARSGAPTAPAHAALSGSGREIRTPMPGVVVAVNVAAGARVEAGAVLVTVEAMKMQNSIAAPIAGTVREVIVKPGDEVMDGAVLLRIEP